LELIDPDILTYEQFLEADFDTAIITGNYPSHWVAPGLIKALNKKFIILVDTLTSDLAAKVNVVLPSATWAEKAGTFENTDNRLQTFEQAIPVIEQVRPEGRIALDLTAAYGLAPASIYDPTAIRTQMAGPFIDDIHHPEDAKSGEPDMQYVQL
jgi:predicted molibdopterin-dependent oxidoreductase YjgC